LPTQSYRYYVLFLHLPLLCSWLLLFFLRFWFQTRSWSSSLLFEHFFCSSRNLKCYFACSIWAGSESFQELLGFRLWWATLWTLVCWSWIIAHGLRRRGSGLRIGELFGWRSGWVQMIQGYRWTFIYRNLQRSFHRSRIHFSTPGSTWKPQGGLKLRRR